MRRREFIMTLLGGAVVWPLRPLPCPRDLLCIFPCVRAACAGRRCHANAASNSSH